MLAGSLAPESVSPSHHQLAASLLRAEWKWRTEDGKWPGNVKQNVKLFSISRLNSFGHPVNVDAEGTFLLQSLAPLGAASLGALRADEGKKKGGSWRIWPFCHTFLYKVKGRFNICRSTAVCVCVCVCVCVHVYVCAQVCVHVCECVCMMHGCLFGCCVCVEINLKMLVIIMTVSSTCDCGWVHQNWLHWTEVVDLEKGGWGKGRGSCMVSCVCSEFLFECKWQLILQEQALTAKLKLITDSIEGVSKVQSSQWPVTTQIWSLWTAWSKCRSSK